MSEELKNTLKYLKNKNNTRRIKTITINEAYEVVEEIERLHSIIKEVREYIEKTKFKYCDDELCYMIENHYNRILEILDKENK